MTRKTIQVVVAFFTLLPFLLPETATAHSFGKLYTLPIPFWMYLYGGVAAIVASFLVIGYFVRKTSTSVTYPTFDLSRWAFSRFFTKTWLPRVAKITGFSLFLLAILTGILGTDLSSFNFSMTFFWVIFVLGLTYLTVFIGDIWSTINPWKTLVEWLGRLWGQKNKGVISYPQWLGYYPAFIFYFLFIWIELYGHTTPIKLSFLLIQYTMANVVGVMIVGREAWFKYCEFFSVFFRLLGKIAPVECREGKLYLRPPLIGLLKESAEHFSLLLFVLFMLSSTAFDGFHATTPFFRLYWGYLHDALKPILGGSAYQIFGTVGLLLSPFVFLFVYSLLIALAKILTKSKLSLTSLMLRFAFSLVPIALVYNVAHYYTLLLTEGQNIIRLVSDPFGFGWNLLGTAGYQTNISVIDANVTWHLQVAFILLGHIAAVYLAHLVTLGVLPFRTRALVSQFPMLVLMVVYTMTGLWILAQPIT